MSEIESQRSHLAWLFSNEFRSLRATREAAQTNIFVAVNIETRLVAPDGEGEPCTSVVSEIGLTFLGPLADQRMLHYPTDSNHPRTLSEISWRLPMCSYCIRPSDLAPRSTTEPFLGTVHVVDRSDMETTMLSLLCEARRQLALAPGDEPPALTLVEFGPEPHRPGLLRPGYFDRALRHMESWVDARLLVGKVMPPRDIVDGLVGLGFAEQRPDEEQGAGTLAQGTVAILAALLYYLPDLRPRGRENEGMVSSRRLAGRAVLARSFPSLGGLRTLDAAVNVARRAVGGGRQRETALFHHFR